MKDKVEASSNVFELSPGHIRDLNAHDPRDAQSGRFRDMPSVDDLIYSVSLEAGLQKRKGLGGRPVLLNAIAGYSRYSKNPRKSHFEFRGSIEQACFEGGTLRLRSSYVPSYFFKNYLADATDMTFFVTRDERVYQAGVYREWGLALDYEQRIALSEGSKSRGRRPRGFWVAGGLSGERRVKAFNDPFPGRDESAWQCGATAELGHGRKGSLGAGIFRRWVQSPVTPEVMILNEPDFQADFNGDGDTIDRNLRTVQNADRSHLADRVAAWAEARPLKILGISLKYEHLWKSFSSAQPYDMLYRSRSDNEDAVKALADCLLASGLHLWLDYKYSRQRSESGIYPLIGDLLDFESQAYGGALAYEF